MWNVKSQNWFSLLYAVMFLSSLATVCGQADSSGGTFRFATMKWKLCSAGFYDPLFPTVCADGDPLRVAFVVEASWSVPPSFSGTGTMIPSAKDEIHAFLTSSPADLANNRQLSVSRRFCAKTLTGVPICAVLRGIGYRLNIDDRSTPNVDESTVPTLSEDPNLGAICTPVTDLQNVKGNTCGAQSTYAFQIDRISQNLVESPVVYARYTFDIRFQAAGDYTVYFEGCCRPSDLSNNFQRPFHIRSGMRLNPGNDQFPISSIRFAMPDRVYLVQGKKTSLLPDASCGTSDCTNRAACAYTFQMRAWFSEDNFFNNTQAPWDASGNSVISYFGGTGAEMGGYWCNANQALSDSIYGPAVCAGGQAAFISPAAAGMPDFQISNDGAGIVTVSAATVGTWQITMMACQLVQQMQVCVPIDFVLVVGANSANSVKRNPRPPIADYGSPSTDALVVATTISSPVTMSCGTSTWRYRSDPASPELSANKVRIVFRELDQWLSTDPTCVGSQQVGWIEQENTFPSGVMFSNLTLITTPGLTSSYSYVDLSWIPQCEDPSQLGLFMMCFRAGDITSNALIGIVPFVSLPSGYSELSQSSDPCLFVRINGPVFPAPPVVYLFQGIRTDPSQPDALSLNTDARCSPDCCICCKLAGCACDPNGEQMDCCPILQAPLTKIVGLVMIGFVIDPSGLFSNLSIVFQYNVADFSPQTDLQPVQLLYPPCINSSTCPVMAPFTAEVEGIILWILTDATGFTSIEQKQQFAKPKSLCVEVSKIVPPTINQALWSRFYPNIGGDPQILKGFEPSCKYCFALTAVGIPFFVMADQIYTNGTEVSTNLEFVVGHTRIINLMGASTIRPDPTIVLTGGLPNGAILADQENVEYSGVPSGRATLRRLIFTPQEGQEGKTFEACFSVDDVSQASDFLCFLFTVTRTKIAWSYPNWPVDPAGGILPTNMVVGCKYEFDIVATSPYELGIALQTFPQLRLCSDVYVPSGIECLKFDAPESLLINGGTAIGVAGCSSSAQSQDQKCCGDGVCDITESKSSCPIDCHGDDGIMIDVSAPIQISTVADGTYENTIKFTWIPTSEVAGKSLVTCLAGYPTEGAAISTLRVGNQGPSICRFSQIMRCKFCVSVGLTLKSISKNYLHSVSWPLLYNSNPDLISPDILGRSNNEDKIITLGPVYTVQPGDTLLSIAGWARLTVKTILELNPDINNQDSLQSGQPLCLFVCSASR